MATHLLSNVHLSDGTRGGARARCALLATGLAIAGCTQSTVDSETSGDGDSGEIQGDGAALPDIADPPDQTDTMDGAPPEDDPVPIVTPELGVWSRLIDSAWDLAAGSEGYWCRRLTVAEDIYVRGFRAVAPPGTHHTTLGKDSGGPDGTFRCGGFSTGTELLFGSGASAGAFELPNGVAVKLTAGEQILLNLHVYNTSIDALSGRSGIEMLAVDPAAVEHDVAFVLAGKAGGLTVPPGRTTETGTCTTPSEVTLLSVGAHMHTHGVHQRVTAYPTMETPVVLLDAPYDFNEPTGLWLDDPIVLPPGGTIQVDCTYENESSQTITFGEGTDDEMCYAGIFHYPRFQEGSTCVR